MKPLERFDVAIREANLAARDSDVKKLGQHIIEAICLLRRDLERVEADLIRLREKVDSGSVKSTNGRQGKSNGR